MGIIPVNYSNEEITILGRDLHAALEIKTPYTMWFKRMCEYGFEKGVDYIQILEPPNQENLLEESSLTNSLNLEESESTETKKFKWKNPNPEENHQMKLDMAKEIAMIQRSETGRKVRKYFIEVEKKYRDEKIQSRTENFQVPDYDVRAKALMSAGNCAVILNTMLGVDLGIARAHSVNNAEKDYGVDLSDIKKLIPGAETTPEDYTPTQLAEKLSEDTGLSFNARQVNAFLKDRELQYKENKEWKLTEKGKSYGTAYPYERNGHTGFQIRWNKRILKVMKDYFSY